MTFSVNGIKQEKNDKYPIEILVCVDAPLLARKILQKTNILILTLKEFSSDRKTFGDIYFTISLNFQEIEIITKYADIQEACNFFMFMGFDITAINSYSKPIAPQDITAIIAKARADAADKKAKVQEQTKKEEAQEKKVYEDVRLQSAKKIMARVFEKVDEATKRGAGKISTQEMKDIKSLTEELRKLRMGTNYEKIRDTIKEIFVQIEKLNDDYFASIQDHDATILNESLITKTDVDRELERIENIRILKELGAHIEIKNQDYAIFGASAIYRKFFQKDFLYRFADLGSRMSGFIDIVEFICIIIIALLGVYTLADQIYMLTGNPYGLAFSLINVGIRAVVIFIARLFRNKNIGRLLLLILLAIIFHYLLMRVITTNFAL